MDWRHVCYEINNVVYGAALRLRAAGGWMAAPHPHSVGDVRPHGSGRARPVLRRGYAPDGRVHSLCTLRIPVICVRGDAVQAMNGV